jgi:hypothetical protein
MSLSELLAEVEEKKWRLVTRTVHRSSFLAARWISCP